VYLLSSGLYRRLRNLPKSAGILDITSITTARGLVAHISERFTAGGESHPALKMFIISDIILYHMLQYVNALFQRERTRRVDNVKESFYNGI